MAGFEFTRVAAVDQPVAALWWESCRASFRIFTANGREVVIDISRNLTSPGERAVPEADDAEQLEWSPCDRYLAILRHGRVDVWNEQKRKMVTSPVAWNGIKRIAWRPRPAGSEGQVSLATACGLVIWSAEGQFDWRPQQPGFGATALSWDQTGTWLAVGCNRNRSHLWNALTNQSIGLDSAGLHELAWGGNGARLAGASVRSLFVWNLRGALHGRTEADWIRNLDAPISRLAFRPGSNILATGNIYGEVRLWRAANAGDLLQSADLGAPVTQLAWSANGKHLAAATGSGDAYVARVCR